MNAEEKLEWQAELDSALAQIDSRLRHPRRRATDDPEAPLPERQQQAELSGEMLDQIALKVADHLRRSQVVSMPGAVVKEAPPRLQRAPAPVHQLEPPPEPEPQLRPGKMLAIRVRWPLFRFRLFGRRKRLHPLSTLDLHAK